MDGVREMASVIIGPGCDLVTDSTNPDSKVYGANMGPTWGRQDPGELHIGPMNFAIWENNDLKPMLLHWCKQINYLL